MTPKSLQALRSLLFFSRQDAAQLVAASKDRPKGVSDRAWRMWERGELTVPNDVAMRILGLVEWRRSAIDAAIKQIGDMDPNADIYLVWYSSIDDWATLPGRDPVLWRPHQSVCAALLSEFPYRICIVEFDVKSYSTWLGIRDDSEAMRNAWAHQRRMAAPVLG